VSVISPEIGLKADGTRVWSLSPRSDLATMQNCLFREASNTAGTRVRLRPAAMETSSGFAFRTA
jgi:hypothetical protein